MGVFWEKRHSKGHLTMSTVRGQAGTWMIEVRCDGEMVDDGQPQRLTDADRRIRGLPPQAALAIGKAIFTQSDAPAILDAWSAAKAAAEAELRAAAAAALPIGYFYATGCDAPSVHRVEWADDIPVDVRAAAAERYRPIERHATFDDFRRVAEETGAEVIEPTLSTYGGWRYDAAGLARLLAIAAPQAEGRRAAAERRGEELRTTAVPAEAVAAYRRYSGDPDEAWADEDEAAWSLINSYADAIEAQALAPDATGRKLARELHLAAREASIPGEG